jgi:hypothetical protein
MLEMLPRRRRQARATARFIKTPSAAATADLADAARALRHLAWHDDAAISEAFAVIPRVSERDAPALYTTLAEELTRIAEQRAALPPSESALRLVATRLRRQLATQSMSQDDAVMSARDLLDETIRKPSW